MMNGFYFSACVKYSDKKNCFNLHLLTCLTKRIKKIIINVLIALWPSF
jgi:hypothetical protein